MGQPSAGGAVWVDLEGAGWDAIERTDTEFSLGAMVTLSGFPKHLQSWPEAAALAERAGSAMAASTKVLRRATIGGNLALALPVGVVLPLALLWGAHIETIDTAGRTRRRGATDFQTGASETVLSAGEWIRALHLPVGSLRGSGHVEWMRLTPSSPPTLTIWLWQAAVEPSILRVVVSGGVPAPIYLELSCDSAAQAAREVAAALSGAPWLDDVLGPARYRRGILPVLVRRACAALEMRSTA